MPSVPPTLGFIVPCYNEHETLPWTLRTLLQLLHEFIDRDVIHEDSFLLFVDDGSTDMTWMQIERATIEFRNVRGIKLSANAGHQNALLAGMMSVRKDVDCVVTLDADLQDDISVIEDMLGEYANGCEIVYGIRDCRDSDSCFKRRTAEFFYKTCNALGIRLKQNHADFRLVSGTVLEALSRFREPDLFLRGIFPIIGFKSADVYYARKERQFGKTKYPLRKMFSFAWTGITSFSTAPLKFAGILGMFTLIFTIVLGLGSLYQHLRGVTVEGWTSLMLAILFLGSVQLISICILGEYIGKIYIGVKRRPNYIVEKQCGGDDA